MRITKEEAFDIADDLEPILTLPWRWGHRDLYVFEREGKRWGFWVKVHCQEGWQISDDVECVEAEEKPRRQSSGGMRGD